MVHTYNIMEICFVQLRLSTEWKEMLDILTIKWPLDPSAPKDFRHYRTLCQLVGNSVLVNTCL